jgi:hypothetical protein
VGPKVLTNVNQLTPLNIRVVSGQARFGVQPGQRLPDANGGDNQPPDPLCEASFDSVAGCGDLFGDLFGATAVTCSVTSSPRSTETMLAPTSPSSSDH